MNAVRRELLQEKEEREEKEILRGKRFVEEDKAPSAQEPDQTPPSSSAPSIEARLASAEFLALIPRDFAREHLVLSQGTIEGVEQLAVAATTSPAAVFNVGVRLQRPVRALQVEEGGEERIARAIDEAFGGRCEAGELPDTLEAAPPEEIERLLEVMDRDLLSTQGKGPIVKLVDSFLFDALGRSASDIHVQPLAERALVRYRVDGALHTVREIPLKVALAVTSRIKVMGRMDIAERRTPQDGRATVTIGERRIDLRISTFPTSYGERTVLRLLDNTQRLCDFASLGMPPDVAETFLRCARRANGIVLVTGPTGSGKTTTLYATLRQIATSDLNVMTIEDPIEYELATMGVAISQAQVNSRKGVTFATGLRHILRQDPDVILVGEIRDIEIARIAIQSSLTGHLVFSTLHTNDAPSALTRLLDLGVEPYLVSSSLVAVLAQRLVRLLHRDCGGQGCEGCFGTGLLGRTGLFELLLITEEIRSLIGKRADLAAIRSVAQERGMRSLLDEGRRLVASGRTTSLEVERVVQETL
ncbi:MAG: GspE/PulE family protein [Planctomycetota bacterium]